MARCDMFTNVENYFLQSSSKEYQLGVPCPFLCIMIEKMFIQVHDISQETSLFSLFIIIIFFNLSFY